MLAAPSLFRRVIAKMLDYLLFIAAYTVICTFLPIQLTILKLIFVIFLVSFLWIPFEVIFLKLFKTTPGKFLMGIALVSPLKWKELFSLSWIGAIKSFTLFIPVFNLFAAWVLFKNEPLIPTYFVSKKRSLIGVVFGSLLLGGLFFSTYEVADIDETEGLLKEEMVYIAEGKNLAWNPFNTQGDIGKIELPSTPSERIYTLKLPKEKDGSLDLKELFVTDEASQIEYTITTVEIPYNLMSWGPKMILKGSFDIVEKNTMGAKVFEKKSFRHLNLPSLHYLMGQGDKEKMGRLILVGNQLIRIEVTYPLEKKVELEAEITKFLTSFTPN